ncbi:MAG: hypothetical protein M1822_003367 [Bathelium mastoideum]|nr:MAG: hypothetical protein M1822_003367 [Bathelium mastoideum]
MTEANITVLGAGVVGLTTALLLSKNPKNNVTVVAKHMPGDYDIEYASPWAGANFFPVAKPGSLGEQYERNTWPELERLASRLPEAGVHFQGFVHVSFADRDFPYVIVDSTVYNRAKDTGSLTQTAFAELLKPDAWFKTLVPNFRVLPKDELPEGIDSATNFTSVCINISIYLPWLTSQCLRNGVVLKRGIVSHVADAANHHHTGKRADVVVNCTGLSSRFLGGVEDSKVFPARGQTVVVRNEPGIMTTVSGTDDGSEESTYIMQRAAGGGTILGGCYQVNNWESQPDLNLATRIMKRCVELAPKLTNGGSIEALSIIRHAVGLRPVREGGQRIEKENIGDVTVVHNYGHGGYGYQTSYGTAGKAVELVESALQLKAKL